MSILEVTPTPSLPAAIREALDALSAAATEVNNRYIGGSKLRGRLGDAIEGLAQANARAIAARRTEDTTP